MKNLSITKAQKNNLQNAIKTAIKSREDLTALLNENFSKFSEAYLLDHKTEKGVVTALANLLASFIFEGWYYKRSVLSFIEKDLSSKEEQNQAIALAKDLELECSMVEFATGEKYTVIFKSNSERKLNKQFVEKFPKCFNGQSEPNGSNFLFTFANTLYNNLFAEENGSKGGNDPKGVNALQNAIAKVNKQKATLTKDEITATLASIQNLASELQIILKTL